MAELTWIKGIKGETVKFLGVETETTGEMSCFVGRIHRAFLKKPNDNQATCKNSEQRVLYVAGFARWTGPLRGSDHEE